MDTLVNSHRVENQTNGQQGVHLVIHLGDLQDNRELVFIEFYLLYNDIEFEHSNNLLTLKLYQLTETCFDLLQQPISSVNWSYITNSKRGFSNDAVRNIIKKKKGHVKILTI